MKQWEANSSTFQAPKEEHFRQKLHYAHLRQSFLSQLDSGESAGINPGMLQLLSCMISHFLFCWFHLPCAFGTADDNSTRLLFMQDFLCGKDSLGSSCWPLSSLRFAADSQWGFLLGRQNDCSTSCFYVLFEGGAKKPVASWTALKSQHNTINPAHNLKIPRRFLWGLSSEKSYIKNNWGWNVFCHVQQQKACIQKSNWEIRLDQHTII